MGDELREAIRNNIDEETSYGISCERCNDYHGDYDTEQYLIEDVSDSWQLVDGKLTCGECIRDPGRVERRKARMAEAKKLAEQQGA